MWHTMECDKTPILLRLAVVDPATIQTAPWQSHLETCAACRTSWHELEESLAIYRHIEHQRAHALAIKPSWEAFCRRSAVENRRRKILKVIRAPVALGVVCVLFVGAVIGWQNWTAPVADDNIKLAGSAEANPQDPPIVIKLTRPAERPVTLFLSRPRLKAAREALNLPAGTPELFHSTRSVVDRSKRPARVISSQIPSLAPISSRRSDMTIRPISFRNRNSNRIRYVSSSLDAPFVIQSTSR